MSFPDFADFETRCHEQDVGLHTDVIGEEQYWLNPVTYRYAPSPLLRAVTAAGALLEGNPELELAEQPVSLDRRLAHSGLIRGLTGIINTSIERVGVDDMPGFIGTGHSVDACRSADFKFANTVHHLEKGYGQCQIIGDDEPLLLRKRSLGNGSALSFRTLAVNGVAYPPGSIFHIGLNPTRARGRLVSDPMPDGVEAIGTEEVTELNFMRLSAFALSVAERAVHFDDHDSGHQTEYPGTPVDPSRIDVRQRSLRSLEAVVRDVFAAVA